MGIKVECCICYMHRDNTTDTWSYPTPEERREYFVTHKREITHAYCPDCYPLAVERMHQDLAEHGGLAKIVKHNQYEKKHHTE